MTQQERAEKAQQIYNDAIKNMGEVGYYITPVLLPKLPSDQCLIVEPQLQLRPIPEWKEPEPVTAPALKTVK